jgi:hypothetical protein
VGGYRAVIRGSDEKSKESLEGQNTNSVIDDGSLLRRE